MTVADRITRKRERLAKHGRALDGGVDEVAVRAATYTLQEAFDIASLDMGLLDKGELAEAAKFADRIRRVETAPVVASAPGAQVERWAAKAVELSARPYKGRPASPAQIRNGELLAERARKTGRIPNDAERSAILAAPLGATLASLRLPSPSGGGEIISRGIDLGVLDEQERGRLETLVEVAAGAEPGSIFEPRRERQRLRTGLAAEVARLLPGARRRQRVDGPGVLALDGAALVADLLVTNATDVGLNVETLGVFVTLMLFLECRKLPEGVAETYARLVDDDNAIEVRPQCSPLGATTAGGRAQIDFAGSLADLVRLRWLSKSTGGDGWTKIARGPRLVAFLAKREEVGS